MYKSVHTGYLGSQEHESDMPLISQTDRQQRHHGTPSILDGILRLFRAIRSCGPSQSCMSY